MPDVEKILETIREHEVKYVDFRFTDPRGKWQHLAHHVRTVDHDLLTDGVMFDGSSIAGWKAINDSDMTLMPDLSTAVLDPFAAQTQLVIICDIIEPGTGQAYARDPRSTAKKAEAYLGATGIGDKAFFGAEAEFFVFDDVRYKQGMNSGAYEIDSDEAPWNSFKTYPDGNTGHRPPIKGGYFPVPPVDSAVDLRAEMLSVMLDMGHKVAHQYGKSATFMPKPIKGDNGSGMHVHQSIWKEGKPSFAGSGYADLSDLALYYIGGIIKHAKAVNAFTNPTTNSYKRLIPGFEAPVLLAYSSRNRSASCRIPYVSSPKGKRVEVRFPDPAANPYLAYSAMLMAGLDGIQNKIHPGEAMDKNLYDLPPEELKNVPTVCGSLREALTTLAADHDFLLKGDVFSQDQIESYIELKWEEVYAFEHTPHPIEFQMYYSV